MNSSLDARVPYQTVAQAIRYVRGNVREQPSLERIAAHVGLSPCHFQRVFRQWAGISPKRFVQYLTKESAKALLRRSRDVLAVALETGLSGPGRLHDLMVACEAMTPGEVRALGRGMPVAWGFADTLLGRMLAGITPRGVCHLRFVEPGSEGEALETMRGEWPQAVFMRDDAAVGALAGAIFGGAPAASGPVRVLLRGTNFQIKVWEALLAIPAGHAISYGDLARALGAPGAARAVGSALAKNPVAVLIPCHRVIREGGDVGQYRWGAERKSALLALEQAATEVSSPGLPALSG